MRISITKLLVAFAITIYNYHLPAECVYCYVCNANWQACGYPADVPALRYNMEPCQGSCIVYVNPNTNTLTRSCSSYLGIPSLGAGTETINGVTYTFCSFDGCNTGTVGSAQTTTAAAATTVVKTSPPSLTTATNCPRQCENSGSQNADCSCTCMALYTGNYCENVLCDAAPYPFCVNDFTVADCGQDLVSFMCPKLCNPKCQPGFTTPVTTVGPQTTTKCNLKCQSGSVLNQTACYCKCLPGTSGTLCEIIDCNQADAPFCNVVDCTDDPDFKYFCIKKCKTCDSTIPPTTVTTDKPTTVTTTTEKPTTVAGCSLQCQSGSLLDVAKCACNCLPGTSGQQCEIIDCKQPDSPFCGAVRCDDDPDIKYYCIQKCNTCGNTIPPTTTTKQTTTTTAATTTISVVTSPLCPGLSCQSGSTLNTATCKCECLSSATFGTSCEKIDCSVTDPSLCRSLSCTSDPSVPYLCVHKCNLCPAVTTTVAPVIDPCANLKCRYGGVENIDSTTGVCRCQCMDNFYGDDCSYVNLNKDYNDPVECNDPALDCGTNTIDEDIAGICPLKCLFCGRKMCKNGGLLKVGCICECLDGFSGDDCGTNNAGCDDNPACGTQFPASFCSDALVKTECPTMCKSNGC